MTAKKTAAHRSATKKAPKSTAKTVRQARGKKTATKKTEAKAAARKASAKATARRSRTGSAAASRTSSRPPSPRGSEPGGRETGAVQAAARSSRPAKLDDKALESIRRALEDELGDLQRRQAELEESSFDATQSEISGEVGLDDDFADAGTATFERERDLSIRNNIRDLIDQIGRAVARIDDGTYGTCERCGRPIDVARLKALPHALLCMDCKRREERAR